MFNRYQPQAGSQRTENLGANTGTSQGTTLTASGTANSKGSYVLLGTTGFTWNHCSLSLEGGSASADFLVDVAIDDGGGNKEIVLADIRMPNRPSANATPITLPLPLHVPSGSPLYARCSASTASATMTATIAGFSTGRGGAPGLQRCLALFTPATSRGVQLDPGATANTVSSYVQLTTGVSARVLEWFAILGTAGQTTRSTAHWLMDIATGAAGSEEVVLSVAFSVGVSSTTQGPVLIGPYPTDVLASTAWSARAQCSIISSPGRTFDLCLYGLVG